MIEQSHASRAPTYAPTSEEYYAYVGTLLMVKRYLRGHHTHGAMLSTWGLYSWCNDIFYYACNLAHMCLRTHVLKLKETFT